MKTAAIYLILLTATTLSGQYTKPSFPFPNRVGSADTTAIHYDSDSFRRWADGYVNYNPGSGVDGAWQNPDEALGKAGTNAFEIVALGRGGEITITFSHPLSDGPGWDFAVFENAFNNNFLELAYVEVSSDGVHFVRFPNYSFTANPVPAFGNVDPTFIDGLGGKYRSGYGTPFNLTQLQNAYNASVQSDWKARTGFSSTFRNALVANFPFLDLTAITHIRLIDVVGDGSNSDCEGFAIYDPYKTTGSAGFDLDGVGAFHLKENFLQPQSITFADVPNQRLSDGGLSLEATSDSGLPVTFSLLSGPATLNGTTLNFTGTGAITVEARQVGDATWAAAEPVQRTFHVGEQLQHLSVEPPRNLVTGGASRVINATASSGLPVLVEVVSGPGDLSLNPVSRELTPGNTPGPVALRISQAGDASYAPAEPLVLPLAVVDPGDADAPKPFPGDDRQPSQDTGGSALDSDGDTHADIHEFAAGSSLTDPTDSPRTQLALGRTTTGLDALLVTVSHDPAAEIGVVIEVTHNGTTWLPVQAEVTDISAITVGGKTLTEMTYAIPRTSPFSAVRTRYLP